MTTANEPITIKSTPDDFTVVSDQLTVSRTALATILDERDDQVTTRESWAAYQELRAALDAPAVEPAPVQEPDQCNWPACQTEQHQQGLADHVANELVGQHHRKAVKLTMHQLEECHPRLYGLDDDMLDFARAIEQAVWTKLGVTE